MHITQPTLSRQLKQLEDELGVALFTHSNHNIHLTAEGHLLRRRAEEMVQLAEQTRADLLPQTVLAGQISIGCGELRSVQELSQHMHNFQQLHPQVTFDLYTGDNSNIQDRLHQGTLDMGLLLEPVDLSKYNYIRSIPRIRGVPLAFNLKWIFQI